MTPPKKRQLDQHHTLYILKCGQHEASLSLWTGISSTSVLDCVRTFSYQKTYSTFYNRYCANIAFTTQTFRLNRRSYVDMYTLYSMDIKYV